MSTVRFNRRPGKGKLGTIQMIYIIPETRKKLVMSTGVRVFKDTWNIKRYTINTSKKYRKLGTSAEELNNELDKWKSAASEALAHFRINKRIPTTSELKHAIHSLLEHGSIEQESKYRNNFAEISNRFLEMKRLEHRTIGKPSKKMILQYEVAITRMIDFLPNTSIGKNAHIKHVNKKIGLHYIEHLQTKYKLKKSTIKRYMKRLKSVFRWAKLQGIKINDDFLTIQVVANRKFRFHITSEQIKQIASIRASSKKLEKVRMLFILGLRTGLRFSDFSKLKQSDLIETDGQTAIPYKTKKTKTDIIIPAHPDVISILNAYPEGLEMSLQKFNLYVKELMKELGFTDLVYPEGSDSESGDGIPLYQLCSSHICRYSFATNGYFSGVPISFLRMVTGHASDQSFLHYVDPKGINRLKDLSQYSFFTE